MLNRTIDFENLIIVVIFVVALVVFGMMLVTVFVSLRSGYKTSSTRISREAWNDSLESAKMILERSHGRLMRLNWIVCLVIATFVAWLTYSRELFVLQRSSFYPAFIGLAILSPTCLGVAWLRLTGTSWRRALSLLLWVPIAFGCTLLIAQLAQVLLFYLG